MTYPSKVFIIRHAEKPSDDKNIHLSSQGKRRASALVGLFGRGGRLAGADYLIATDKSKHSNRSVETLEPLSRSLGLSTYHEFEDDEYRDLAKRLKSREKYQGATILIAWHHGSIPALAKALGVMVKDLPWRSWPDDVYDRVWILDFVPGGPFAIHSEPQGLAL